MKEKIITKIKDEIILLLIAGALWGMIWVSLCYLIDIHEKVSYIYENIGK